ncbi:HORMA domain containing protein [Albidovulum sediminis]|uniref:HORMA domain containing protein n=1 Tax=Albidovulum sediminis TaxID=3066345 RepID=A0ABT2NV92_9RHOB|nr:HORMA domain containing protein [Defluviimonas sediminis]MCT8331859.1 HORMA domain containing protein [Defluviimonas sediminis]
MSTVSVNTYTHSVTYLADNMLKSVKDIIVESGLDPSTFVGDWEFHKTGMRTWLQTGHLEKVVLEVFDPSTDALVVRWDIEVAYGWSANGDGSFWTDTDQLRYAIKKSGVHPSRLRYRFIVTRKAGFVDVAGWVSASFRSTAGMVRQSLGTTVEHNGLGASTSYYRRT